MKEQVNWMDKYVDRADCKDGRSVDVDTYGTLRAGCDSCFGLCCTALYFSASDGFPNDKIPGIPCGYLQPDFRCGVHQHLTLKGFKGCRDYDCFGAGQKVSQLTFAGTDWITKPESAPQMFAVFLIMQQLHELLWYLAIVQTLPEAAPIHKEIGTMIGNTLLLTQSKPSSIVNLDMAGHRIAVDRLLIKASGLVRRNVHAEYNIDTGRQKIFPHRAVLIAANLTKYDLRGVDLRGACLIAADLRQSELVGTDFIGADFRDADVRGADLSRSLFLTQNQINSAKGDASTRLPSYLIRPEHWGKEFGEVINMGEESKRTVTVEDYIVASPEAIQPRLREIRRIIIDAAPQLKEKISWQMPTFYSERNIIHFAAHKNHIGLYPGPKAIEFFEDRLTGYKTSKGAIQLPHQKELDPDLIRDLVRYNLEGYR